MSLRPTHVLGAVSVAGTALAIGIEYAHVWRRGHAPNPSRGQLLEGGRIAARETLEVAFAGYRGTPPHENALLNLLVSFTGTFAGARATTHAIRRWGTVGPLGHMKLGERHIHHLVPGIVMSLISGSAAVTTRDPNLERWIAIPFGAGAALTLDEAALLIELEDVYWSERGVVSVQIALAAMALLASAVLWQRVLRRGEYQVLGEPSTNRAGGNAPADTLAA